MKKRLRYMLRHPVKHATGAARYLSKEKDPKDPLALLWTIVPEKRATLTLNEIRREIMKGRKALLDCDFIPVNWENPLKEAA